MNSSGIRYSSRSIFVSVAALGMFGGMLGCPVINAEHCAFEGSQTLCGEGLMCSKCEIGNNGCVAPDAVAVECMLDAQTSGTTKEPETTTTEPTSSTSTTDTSSDTTLPTNTEVTTVDETDSTSTSTSTTTDPDTTATSNTTGTECDPDEGNADCIEDMRPYCTAEGTCISCSEGDCDELDPGKPECSPGGRCVECINSNDCSDGLFCDPDTATCKTCTMHEQCKTTACNLEFGTCFPDDNVIFVENTPDGQTVKCSDLPANEGKTENMPFCRLSVALTRAVPDAPLTIKVKQGTLQQNQANPVPPGVTVAIVRKDNTPVTLVRNGTDPALSVTEGSQVFVNQINAVSMPSGLAQPLFLCDGASLWLERVSVFNGKTGIIARQCMLTVRRSVVFENVSGGIDVTETTMNGMSKLWLENSYVTNNTNVFGVRASNNSFLDIVYSTIAGNTQEINNAAIACTAIPPANMRLRNSLIVSATGNFTNCNFAVPDDDLTNAKFTNDTLQSLVVDGIAQSQAEGVVKAKVGGPLENKAIWLTGDPAHDYDVLNVRPTVDGTPDYAGADVP
jgi:hypothetical protein